MAKFDADIKPGFVRLEDVWEPDLARQVFSFDEFIRELPRFKERGAPDLVAIFEFRGPRNLKYDNQVAVSIHKQVLAEASPVTAGWLKNIQAGSCLVQFIECEEYDCVNQFIKFLVFLYTRTFNSAELIPVFGFNLQFQVPMLEADLKGALTTLNILQLLDRHSMTNGPLERLYRKWIKETADPLWNNLIRAPYFVHMKAATLEEIITIIVSKADINVSKLKIGVYLWASAELQRRGIAFSTDAVFEVIPHMVKYVLGWSKGMFADRIVITTTELYRVPFIPAQNVLHVQPLIPAQSAFQIQSISSAQSELEVQEISSVQGELQVEPITSAQSELQVQPINSAQNGLQLLPINSAQSELQLQPITSAQSGLELQPISSAQSGFRFRPLTLRDIFTTQRPCNTRVAINLRLL